ncbi:hypothetical protein ACYJW8_07170 [Frateuria aurantia]
MKRQQTHDAFRQRAAWISLVWGGGGLVLLLTSPLPGWTPGLGWSPLFWLVLAPVSVLAALWMSRSREAVPGDRRLRPLPTAVRPG